MNNQTTRKRYGRRAEGQTQCTISIEMRAFNKATRKANQQNKSLSWLISGLIEKDTVERLLEAEREKNQSVSQPGV